MPASARCTWSARRWTRKPPPRTCRGISSICTQMEHDKSLVRVGLFGQLNLEWWKVARDLDMHILTEFIGDLAKLGPEFAAQGVLGSHNIFNHCTRVPQETWKLFADAGVNITVNPRSDALFGFDDETSLINRRSITA